VIQIDIDYLLGGIKSPGELTERLSGVFSEAAAAGNIIIYFENFQNLLSSGDAGKVDATEVLLSFLDSPEMHIVGTCDIGNFNRHIATNSSLVQRFTRVTVEEPTSEEMIRILEDTVPIIEYKTHSIISYEAIKETVSAADKYILNLPNPEKSINLLDGATTKASSQRGKTIILPKDISEYVTEKFDVPAGEVEEGEKQKLLMLEDFLHQSVIGQAEAIAAISNALRRARAGVTNSKKPIGSFLFLGPTGVGKTETAKALSRSYFGAEDRMIRFDMSEFQNKEDIYRLIGSNIGGEAEIGSLTTAVRERPFSLLLFDEIEKAHRDILDLFLQMLDEGIITDGEGRKVSFMNTIIIATSNAGANLIRESINNGEQYENMKKTLLDYLQKENIYRPEFLNRFTGVIAFSPLSQEEINQVAVLMIEKLKETIRQNKGITVEVEPKAIGELAKLGFDPVMGARPMARVIQEKLENLLATKILSGELKKGDSITIGVQDIA
jgi:ATP-dependent Clp protease ATP-binding subunit ClpC